MISNMNFKKIKINKLKQYINIVTIFDVEMKKQQKQLLKNIKEYINKT